MGGFSFIPFCGSYADFLLTTADSLELRPKMQRLGATVIEREGHTLYVWGFAEALARVPDGLSRQDSQSLPREACLETERSQPPGAGPIGPLTRPPELTEENASRQRGGSRPLPVLMSGIGILDGRLVVGPAVLDEMPMRVSAGKCVLLDLRSAVTRIRGDLLGMQPVYYGADIVTNRLHLAALVAGKLDAAAALSIVHNESAFCNQYGVIRTPVAGVSLLQAHQGVDVDSTVRVVADEGAQQSAVLGPSEYRELIRKGAEEILQNIDAIMRSGHLVVSALTGGKDSRVLLAALVALGRVKDVRFTTSDVGQDVALATGLVKRFGGAYRDPIECPIRFYARSLEECMAARRSQLFGTYHEVPAFHLRTVSVAPALRSIQMDGGCGELYRDFYQPSFRGVDQEAPVTPESVRLMLQTSRAWKALWPGHLDRIGQAYVDTFEALPGSTLGAKLDSHYLNFRNRYHFGVNLPLPIDHHGMHPLCSPSLLRAARALPQREKAKGRVVFDVTRELCEELAYLPYDKPWPTDLAASPYHSPSRFDGVALDLQPAPEMLDRGKVVALEPRPRGEKLDLPTFCFTSALENLAALRERRGCFSYLAAAGFEDYLRALENKKDTRHLSHWWSRLQALRDYGDLLTE